MTNSTRYLGLDVHAETITAAIAEGRGQIRSLGKFPNRPGIARQRVDLWKQRQRVHGYPAASSWSTPFAARRLSASMSAGM